MGITGLLKAIQGQRGKTRKGSLSKWSGQRLGIDGHTWLHRGAIAAAQDLVLGLPTRKHVTFCLRRMELLLNFDVVPIFVFDGAPLPAKKETSSARRQKRLESRENALRLIRDGGKGAYKECMKAVEITPAIVKDLIDELRARNIECIVAPYEADAQLGYLARIGYVDGVITEDSDLLLHSCDKVLFKLDDKGTCDLLTWNDVLASNVLPPSICSKDAVRLWCILAGCDYLKSVEGVGLKTAARIIEQSGTDLDKLIHALMCESLKSSSVGTLPVDYKKRVIEALCCFKFQWVYDPEKRVIKHAAEIGSDDFLELEIENIDLDSVLGAMPPPEVIEELCGGSIDPRTYEPLQSRIEATVNTEVHNEPAKCVSRVDSVELQCDSGAARPSKRARIALKRAGKVTISRWISTSKKTLSDFLEEKTEEKKLPTLLKTEALSRTVRAKRGRSILSATGLGVDSDVNSTSAARKEFQAPRSKNLKRTFEEDFMAVSLQPQEGSPERTATQSQAEFPNKTNASAQPDMRQRKSVRQSSQESANLEDCAYPQPSQCAKQFVRHFLAEETAALLSPKIMRSAGNSQKRNVTIPNTNVEFSPIISLSPFKFQNSRA